MTFHPNARGTTSDGPISLIRSIGPVLRAKPAAVEWGGAFLRAIRSAPPQIEARCANGGQRQLIQFHVSSELVPLDGDIVVYS